METTAIVLLVLAILIGLIAILVSSRAGRARVKEISQIRESLESRLGALETELAADREKLAAILSTTGAGVIILDDERNVTTLNQTAARLFRTSTGDPVGQPFINLSHDYEMDTIAQRCLETHRNQTGLVQWAVSKQYLELTAAPLSSGALILIQDLTSIRRLEKTRQDFIANISHELRTPMASCKAIVETLQGGAINDIKVADNFLERMHVEIDKMAQMVSELGELSRIESGELKLKREPVDIGGMVTRVTERLRMQADRTGLSITLNIPPDLPPVMGDADRIEQVLVNLMHNAIKFTPRNGEITVSSTVKDDMIFTSVEDTGIGIPEDDLPHIFERFYKVDKARSGGGTGLGLAIAKHIIQAHNGEIRAESEEGRGSTFTFSLPIGTS